MSLEQLYQQVILDHSKEKHGHGVPAPVPGTRTASSHQYNPLCGDEITLQVAVLPDAGADTGNGSSTGNGADTGNGAGAVVAQLSWVGDGCSISQASSSVLHDLVVGRPVAEAEHVVEAFRTMIRSRGEQEPDEELLGDAVAFVGVGRHANRVKCAMLGWTAFEDAVRRALADVDRGTDTKETR